MFFKKYFYAIPPHKFILQDYLNYSSIDWVRQANFVSQKSSSVANNNINNNKIVQNLFKIISRSLPICMKDNNDKIELISFNSRQIYSNNDLDLIY